MENLGESIILNLEFITSEGISSKDIKPGTWIIIFGEIPIRKLKNGAFACYPECDKIDISQLEKKSFKNMLKIDNTFEYEPYHKYKWCNGKIRRNNFWKK